MRIPTSVTDRTDELLNRFDLLLSRLFMFRSSISDMNVATFQELLRLVLEGVSCRITQLPKGRPAALTKFEMQVYRPSALAVWIHGLTPSSPISCPYPQLPRIYSVPPTSVLPAFFMAFLVFDTPPSCESSSQLLQSFPARRPFQRPSQSRQMSARSDL